MDQLVGSGGDDRAGFNLAQYDRVRHCRLEDLTPQQTAEILDCSMALVEEYLRIDRQLQDRTSRSSTDSSPGDPSASDSVPIPWLDFAVIRRQVTLQQLLSHLNLWDQFRRSQSDPAQWRGPCPIHASAARGSTKHQPTFSVNVDQNLFQCFEASCRASGNVQTFSLKASEIGSQEPRTETTQNGDS